MSKTRKILAACLAVSAIATIVMVINAVISPETSSILTIICTGIVPVVLCIALFTAKNGDEEKK